MKKKSEMNKLIKLLKQFMNMNRKQQLELIRILEDKSNRLREEEES